MYICMYICVWGEYIPEFLYTSNNFKIYLQNIYSSNKIYFIPRYIYTYLFYTLIYKSNKRSRAYGEICKKFKK